MFGEFGLCPKPSLEIMALAVLDLKIEAGPMSVESPPVELNSVKGNEKPHLAKLHISLNVFQRRDPKTKKNEVI